MNATKNLNVILILGIIETLCLSFSAYAKILHLFNFEIVFLLVGLLKIISIFVALPIIKELKTSFLLKLSYCIITFSNILIAGVLLHNLLNMKTKEVN